MLNEIRRYNRNTRDKRIKWHQRMDKKYGRTLKKRLIRKTLVCPIKKW